MYVLYYIFEIIYVILYLQRTYIYVHLTHSSMGPSLHGIANTNIVSVPWQLLTNEEVYIQLLIYIPWSFPSAHYAFN